MKIRYVLGIVGTIMYVTCSAMDYRRGNSLQDEYDEDVARAVELSVQDQRFARSAEAQMIADYELALQLHLQDEDSQEYRQSAPQVATVPTSAQQELDADYALALELSMQDGQPVFHRSIRPRMGYQEQRRLDPLEQRRREQATKIAIHNHLTGPIVPYGSHGMFVRPDQNLQMPSLIRTLPVPVIQLSVLRQHEAGTCGSRSVANALALRDLLAKGLTVTSGNIQSMAKKYEYLHVKSNVSSREQIELARHFGLTHTYVLGIYQMDPIHGKQINRYPFTVIDSTEIGAVNLYQESEVLEDIVKTIRENKTITAHFLCHLDGQNRQAGHSVVISIVKAKGQPTRIIYMDSNNAPITDHCQAAAYICYLYWQCIA